MSLTREQWEEMWKSIKYVEMHEQLSNKSRKETQKIKDLIQSVVGQME
jgi:transcription initiation factor IIE alpha subunit